MPEIRGATLDHRHPLRCTALLFEVLLKIVSLLPKSRSFLDNNLSNSTPMASSMLQDEPAKQPSILAPKSMPPSEGLTSDPMADAPPHYDAAIIGAGWAGMWALNRLREEGFNVIGIEANEDFGGWFELFHCSHDLALITFRRLVVHEVPWMPQ